MKILFDYSIFYHQTHGGISRYFINLNNELLKENLNSKILAPLHNNIFLKNYEIRNFLNIYIKNYPRYSRKIIKKYNDLFTYVYSKIFRPNIIHKTFYFDDFILNKKIKKVLTVYDLVHEIYYKDYNFEKNHKPKKKILENVDFIICPSNKTKKDLMEIYNVPNEKIKVIYMGIYKFSKNYKNHNLNFQKPFILFVGDRKRYKNFINLIKAYSKSKRIQNDFDIICFGGNTFLREEIEIISKLNINKKNLIQISGDDSKLYWFYKNARAFIFPSKYEGLGLPQLEAMSLECPVICSNHEAILEAVGDAAVFFNPNDPEDILLKINKVLYSEDEIKKLKLKGLERSKLFTWEKCAKETIEVYKKITN